MIELPNSGLTLDDAGKWFVTTAPFKRGGRKIEGPFPTRAAATDARGDDITHYIDQAPHTMIRFNK
jgi:hypothetical protein